MTIYDKIGSNYNKTRNADKRIVNNIVSLLNCPANSKIADIGAGTGNYSLELAKKGYSVYAVEPSKTMIKQGKHHKNLKWYQGYAENMPFEDCYFDAAICILASHHFKSIEKGFKEIYRIMKKGGSFVLFSQDPRRIEGTAWFKEYLKLYYLKAFKTLPETKYIKKLVKNIFHSNSKIKKFVLPQDLKDSFFYSAWKYPEKYLEEDFRKGISIFSTTKNKQAKSIIDKLKKELLNGKWDNKYGFYRKRHKFEGGYYFLSIKK